MFQKNQKKKGADAVTPQEVEHAAVTEKHTPLVFSEEGLFDIAYENYRQAHPESGMKRRDFRRNIWGSEEMADYLSDGQYRKYLEYAGAIGLSGEPVLAEKTEAEPTEEPLMRDMTVTGEPADGMSELEPVFDESFLNDLPVEDGGSGSRMISAEDGDALADSVRMDTGDLFGDVLGAEEDADGDGRPAETFLAEAVGKISREISDRTDGNGAGKSDLMDGNDTGTDAEARPAYTGIFALEGMMERLRRSMYLAETDSSRDEEILSLSDKEIFEQLIRLEGCFRKAGVISYLAQQIFTHGSEMVADGNSVKKKRLMEIVSNAANAIGYMMHFECSDENEWNRMIALHLGLTEEERAQGIIPAQPLNREYVIRCYDMGIDDPVCVCGDYTQICRAVFLYEQAYHNMAACPLMQFLESVGLECYTSSDAEAAADIEMIKGKVYLV